MNQHLFDIIKTETLDPTPDLLLTSKMCQGTDSFHCTS